MSIGTIFAKAGLVLANAKLSPIAAGVAGAAILKVGSGALDVAISAVKKSWMAGAGQNYVTATKGSRVEPFVLVDSRFVRLSYSKDVMNVAQRLFTSYYMLSVAADNTIDGVKVSRRLDKYAPDRDLTDATVKFLSNESYHFGLPFVGEAAGLNRYSSFSAESRPVNVIDLSNEAAEIESNPWAVPDVKTTYKSVGAIDVANLAIGQIVDVTFSDGKNSGTVQVMIRLKPIGMDPSVIVPILALGGEDQSHDARKLRVRAGDLSYFADLVQSQDRVRNYRAVLMKDRSGYFRKVHARQNRSWLATLLTGTPNIGQATSIAIISKDTAREVEDRIGGRLDDFETRQTVFGASMLMLLFVVDDDHETVTIYTQDTEDFGVYTLDDIRGAGSKGGSTSDLSDIMKSYLEGKVPGRL